MTTASPRQTRSRRDQAAFTFLSNISLGTETTFPPVRRSSTVPENLLNDGSFRKPQVSFSTQRTVSTDPGSPKKPVLSIDIPAFKSGKNIELTATPTSTETSAYKETSAIEDHADAFDVSVNARGRSSSLREEATNFLMNLSLGTNKHAQKRSSKESLVKPAKGKIPEIDAERLDENDLNDHGSFNSSNDTLNTGVEPEDVKIAKEQSSASSLKNHPIMNVPVSPISLSSPTETPSDYLHGDIRRESLSSSYGSVRTQHSVDYSEPVNDQNLTLAVKQPNSMLSNSPESTFGGILSIFGFKEDKNKHQRSRRDNPYVLRFLKKISAANYNPKALKQNANLLFGNGFKAESYAHLLNPSNSLGPELEATDYNPYYLDDPELKMGKKTGRSLPNFMNSILQQRRARESDLKRDLNARFRQSHPNIDPTLTLTQIRTIKEKLLIAARYEELDLELSTVAKAYVFFEKLVLKKYVAKYNRRLIAAICLFLASKVNEPREMSYSDLLESLHKHLEVSEKEIKQHEFSVFAWLKFELYVPRKEFMPHFERIFSVLEENKQDYLGFNPFYEI
ncbi:hypothetical protein G9A89_016191 [Geosiphon pyriformis]|nr:hypothetical protein G9A89_016191 [Geosiphon pyriformis]